MNLGLGRDLVQAPVPHRSTPRPGPARPPRPGRREAVLARTRQGLLCATFWTSPGRNAYLGTATTTGQGTAGMRDIGHFIGGRRVEGAGGRSGPVFDPATGEQTGRVAFADAAVVDRAVQAALKVQPDWAAQPVLRRARVMFRLKELIERETDRLARLITEEHGKTLEDAKGSITRGLEVVE